MDLKFYVVADFRENFPSEVNTSIGHFNDHPSKQSILEIINEIKNLGYFCEYFGGIPELIHAIDNKQKFENAFFINLTDGLTQPYNRTQAPILLDILDVPFSGSNVLGTTLMCNKYYTKLALNEEPNIALPKDTLVSDYIPLNPNIIKNIGFPVIVKPNLGGSSIGIDSSSVCSNFTEVENKVKTLIPIYKELLIEHYIAGLDVTNFIIGNKDNFKINEVIINKLDSNSCFPIYGTDEKTNKKRVLCSGETEISSEILTKIKKNTETIFYKVNAFDIARVDYRLEFKTNIPYFLEINSAPRFSKTSEVGFIAEKFNISIKDIIKEYIISSLTRFNININ